MMSEQSCIALLQRYDILVVNARYYNNRVQQKNFLQRLIKYKYEHREAELMRWQSEVTIMQVTLNSRQRQ